MIKIQKIDSFGPDERGSTRGVEIRPSGYILILRRKKGTVSGSHYHKGTISSKNPEIFYSISGKARLIAKNIETNVEESYEIEENMLIEVPAGIYHELHALTDIIFLELNVKNEDFRNDTYYLLE